MSPNKLAGFLLLLSSYGAVAVAAPAFRKVPYQTLSGGGKLPMLVMGDGISWGRPSNHTMWINLVGAGAGLDSAWDYHSENRIPAEIRAAHGGAGAKREDLFITSKIPCGGFDGGVAEMNATQAQLYIDTVMRDLATPYVDLMLLHHVCPTPAVTATVWAVLENMVKKGQAKAIGVSNFRSDDIAALMPHTIVPIEVNQAHFVVGEMDHETINYCKAHQIALESYGTLHGSINASNPTVVSVGKKHNISGAVVLMRYITQQGITVVSATDSLAYANSDIDMFGITLDSADMAALDALQTGERHCDDCCRQSCQTCQQALNAAGCKANGGDACYACVKKLPSAGAAMKACGSQDPLAFRACYIG
eukprot:g334.t1